MAKYLRISSYIRKPFLIYDFTTNTICISLYMRKISFSFLSVYLYPNPMSVSHWRYWLCEWIWWNFDIRLIENKAKFRSKKFTWKGTLRQVFYLSEAFSPPMTPYSPPYTRYTCIQYTYSHREGGGGVGELTRKKVRGEIVTKPIENTNMTDWISSL